MESSENNNFEEHILSEKKLKFTWFVQKYSQSLNIAPPKILFFATLCPYNDLQEWTHIHSQSNAICVSEKDLITWDYETMESVVKKELSDLVKEKNKKDNPVGSFFSNLVPSKKDLSTASANEIYSTRKKHKTALLFVIVGIIAVIILSNFIKFNFENGSESVNSESVPTTETYTIPENISYSDILEIDIRGYSEDMILKGSLLKEEINLSETLKTIDYYVVDDSMNKVKLNFVLVKTPEMYKSVFPVNNISADLYQINGTLKVSLGELEFYVKKMENYTRKTIEEERVIYVEQNFTSKDSSESKGWVDWLINK